MEVGGDQGNWGARRRRRGVEPSDRRYVRNGRTEHLAWTEKIWGSLAHTDGTLQIEFGLGRSHNRGVIDGFGGVSRGHQQWTVRASRALDPIGYPAEAEAALAAAAAAWATICSPAVVSHSLDHYLEQLEALAS